MTLALVPLSMSTIGLIPHPCRGCVRWELGGATGEGVQLTGQTEFEKEVWLSGVMLTWGSAGLVVTVDDEPAGYALFAPPPTVPGAAELPSGPVSPDAVLLTALRVDERFTGQGVGRFLVEGVIRTLTGRGVRAVEVFGREGERRSRKPGPRACTVPAGFLRHAGFTEVRPHRRYPRLRYELSGELDWKAQVEAALEHLLEAVPAGAR